MAKKFLKWTGIVLAVLAAGGFGFVTYMKSAAAERLEQKFEIPVDPIPVPFPLESAERLRFVEALKAKHGALVDAAAPDAAAPDATAPEAAPAVVLDQATIDRALDQEALRQARERGKRYLESRAACTECHGEDLGGKVIVEDPAMGKWIAPNITKGGLTKDYDSADWVRIIRHGIKPDGRPATMPSRDFEWLSDQEISDIVAYIQGLPTVERVMPPSELGPVLSILIAQGEFPIDAEHIDHTAPRAKLPPPVEATVELGKHLGTTCVGCHGPKLAGGPIIGGDPAWPPAANLTFHETGLKGWTEESFKKALREGVRPDGRKIDAAMPIPYTKNLSDAELGALYVYFKQLSPVPLGTR